MRVNFERLHPKARVPQNMTEGSAGYDLHADIPSENFVTLRPGERMLVPTGIAVDMPSNLEGQIRPRSGLAARHGVTVLNAPGTIDSDYRGEIQVLLVNLGGEAYTVRHGDRIAQLIFNEVTRVIFAEVDNLDNVNTERGGNGFGSTGNR